jgi:hypothetical protein
MSYRMTIRRRVNKGRDFWWIYLGVSWRWRYAAIGVKQRREIRRFSGLRPF